MFVDPSADRSAVRGADPLSPLSLVRLLQLASPALPVGAYSYSQGLERVIEDGIVRDAATAREWIGDVLELVVAAGEGAMLWRMLESAADGDWQRIAKWNSFFLASRETAEMRAETEQMGAALGRLAAELDCMNQEMRASLRRIAPLSFPAAYAITSQAFAIPGRAALIAYIWSWLENQVLAAMKLVPLGQVAGQTLLLVLGARIPVVAERSVGLPDDALSTFAPGLALASARHEVQYTRLFRS